MEDANGAIKTLSTGLRMADAAAGLDVVHSHTWYAGLGGHLAGHAAADTLEHGPLPERSIVLIGMIGGNDTYFEAALLLAMVGFVSTIAYCKFLLRGDIVE